MLVCFNCWGVFEREGLIDYGEDTPCPAAGCVGSLIEIDENLIAIIRVLNEKGYYTTNCCAGHVWGGGIPDSGWDSAYIAFDPDVSRKELEPLPIDWTLDKSSKDGEVIRTEYSGDDPIEFQAAILKGILELGKWADGLEARE